MNEDPRKMDYRSLLKDALYKVGEMQNQLTRLERAHHEPIAILGIGCRFPGGADNPDAFWRILAEGIDTVTEIPSDRWQVEDYYDPDPEATGKSYSRWGAFLKQVDQFDPAFFGISPREAEKMDPQQRLLLEVAWEALENANIAPSSLFSSRTGVFLGMTTSDYAHLETRELGQQALDAYFGSGVAHSIATGRLSYFLGLNGPSISVDTACSSSLVSTHLAVQSLRTGESDLALAGGVNLILTPDGMITASRSRMMSFDGRCKTFDSHADGYVRGEGCGIIVLKRLSDAQQDGDRILAVIAGSALNQDGRSNGLTAPNGLAQEAVIRAALKDAGLAPEDVDYIEAHGTGTSLGDPIEIRALGAVFSSARSPHQPLRVGSVKTNIGHLEASAGVAGIIKVILALQNEMIPPHLHFKDPNPHITWNTLPIQVTAERTPWVSTTTRRRVAGVSSFGFSGTNAHILIGEVEAGQPRQAAQARSYHLLALSAKSKPSLRILTNRYKNYLEENPSEDLGNVCLSANSGRSHFWNRIAVVVRESTQAQRLLNAYSSQMESEGLHQGDSFGEASPSIAFLFTGQGAQHVGMGKLLFQTQPDFRQTLVACDEILRSYIDRSILSVLYPSETGNNDLIHQTRYTQPALFVLEYALARLWLSWGIMPEMILGHSVGEYVAACIAGVMNLEDSLKLIAKRGELMQQLSPEGAMAAVFASEAVITSAITPYQDSLSIAAINGLENIVISGEAGKLQIVLDSLLKQGYHSKRLVVSHAFHSPLMEPILAPFKDFAAGLSYASPQIALILNGTGQIAGPDEVGAAYWQAHARAPVRFFDSIQTLHKNGVKLFIEIGPQPVLLGMAQRCLTEDGQEYLWLPSLRPGIDDWQQMLESLAGLYTRGANVAWRAVDRHYAHRKLSLPTYPFQRSRFWISPSLTPPTPLQQVLVNRSGHPLLGETIPSPHQEIIFQTTISPNAPRFLQDHRISGASVFPASGYVEMALAAALRVNPAAVALEDIQIQEALVLADGQEVCLQLVLTPIQPDLVSIRIDSFDPATRENVFGLARKQHVSGKIRWLPDIDSPGAPDLDTLQAKCSQPFPIDAFYDRITRLGFEYGPSFRNLEIVWHQPGAGQAFGQLRLPDEYLDEARSYYLHPGLLDACFQLIGPAIAVSNNPGEENTLYIPVSLERLRFFAPAQQQLSAYVLVEPDADGSRQAFKAHLQIFGLDKRLVVEVEGLHFLAASQDLLTSLGKKSWESWFYELTWQPISQPSGNADAAGRWLLLADQQGQGQALAALLSSRGSNCELVYAGTTYGLEENGRKCIRPIDKGDIECLLTELTAKPGGAFRGILHLFSLNADPADPPATQELCCGSLLNLTQAVAQNQAFTGTKIWLVTANAQAVGETEPALAVAQSSVWGLGRVIAMEHPEIWGGMIDLPAQPAAKDLEQLIGLVCRQDKDEFAIRQGECYTARLAHIKFLGGTQPGNTWHAEATYLISGGLGGLGLEVARWMARQGARHLALVGRHAPSAIAMETISELEQAGVQVQVLQGDVSQANDVQGILKALSQPLRGIVHAAGVLDDGILLQQDWSRFDKVLAPKIGGAWQLHTQTLKEHLEFFVLFSAGAALLGSRGQGNYAAGNAFLDGLAHYRRLQGLPAISINWGPWNKIGMTAKIDSRASQTWSQLGWESISLDEGLHVFDQLLRINPVQAAVFKVKWDQFLHSLPEDRRPPILASIGQKAGSTEPKNAEEELQTDLLAKIRSGPPDRRLEILIEFILQQAAILLKLSQNEQLLPQQPLIELGFDSLMAQELRNRVFSKTRVSLPVLLVLEGGNSEQMARAILERLENELDADLPVKENEISVGADIDSEGAMRLLERLDKLPDAQVDQLLAELLAEKKKP
jgi:acyl transferase domain-containing protein